MMKKDDKITKPDLAVEVNMSPDKLVESLTDKLCSEYSTCASDPKTDTRSFTSIFKNPSFLQNILKAKPPVMKWSVTATKTNNSRLKVSFEVPAQIERQIYFIMGLIGIYIFFEFSMYRDIYLIAQTGFSLFAIARVLFELFMLLAVLSVLRILCFSYFSLIYSSRIKIVLKGINTYSVASGAEYGISNTSSDKKAKSNTGQNIQVKEFEIKSDYIPSYNLAVFGLLTLPFLIFVPFFFFLSDLCGLNIRGATLAWGLILTAIGLNLFIAFIAYGLKKDKYPALRLLTLINNALYGSFFIFILLSNLLLVVIINSGTHTPIPDINTNDAASVQLGQNALGLHGMEILGGQFFIIVVLCIILAVVSFSLFVIAAHKARNFYLHRRYMEHIFESKMNKRSSLCFAELPYLSKMLMLLFAFMVSCILWLAVLLNISIIDAVVLPDIQIIPIHLGEKFSQFSFWLAYAVVGRSGALWQVNLLKMLLLTLILVPFLFFVSLHVIAFARSCKRYHKLIPITKKDFLKDVSKIAVYMGVKEVACVVDTSSNSISPRAVVCGFVPKNMIVFSKNSLRFFRDNKNSQIPIIAHEMVHLKKHCQRIRYLRILSQISLLGSGFFSVLLNFAKIEKEADDGAQEYIKKNEDCSIDSLLSAIDKISRDNRNKKSDIYGKLLPAAFSSDVNNNYDEFWDIKKPSFSKVERLLKFIYKYYFETDAYDYIHPNAMWRIDNLKKTKQ